MVENDGNDIDADEVLRMDRHERKWRLAAGKTMGFIFCPIRKCRRDLGCSGPMVPSERQHRAVEAQKATGLSGRAVACLPLCVAGADDAAFERCRQVVEAISRVLEADPSITLPRHDRRNRGRSWD